MTGTLRLDEISTRDGGTTIRVADIDNRAAHAWATFDGTTGQIKRSFGVNAVTRDSAGKYTVALKTALPSLHACTLAQASSGDPHASTQTWSCDAAVSLFDTIKVACMAARDPYHSCVSMLLHGDGGQGGGVFADHSSRTKTMTAVGNSVTSTTAFKYGSASMYFDGTGDYLTAPADAEFNFGFGDFTIEAWVNMTTISGSDRPIFSIRDGAAPTPAVLCVRSSGQLAFWGSASSTYLVTGTTVLSTGSWYHVAVSRISGTMRLFVNGVLDGSASVVAAVGSASHTVYVAASPANNQYVQGYIDDLRVTRSVGRYAGNFIVPSAAFPDTSAIVNADAPLISLAVFK